jgi:hypothetical protein
MGKNYPEQLAQWIERRGLARADRNLVAFMAVHDDVKVAIGAGYAVKTVWDNLQETGRIDLSYRTFLNYVRRVLGPLQGQPAACPIKPASSAPVTARPLPQSSTDTAPERIMPLPMAGFTYNPVPNKEELL